MDWNERVAARSGLHIEFAYRRLPTAQKACACGRGLDSGFVSAIKFYRARMGLSVRSDVAGGIFSFK